MVIRPEKKPNSHIKLYWYIDILIHVWWKEFDLAYVVFVNHKDLSTPKGRLINPLFVTGKKWAKKGENVDIIMYGK